MAFRDWFMSLFGKDGKLRLDAAVAGLATEIWYKKLAIHACAHLIANTLSQAEFRTYLDGKEAKEDNYYLLNMEPNPNENARDFWRDAMIQAIYNNEALIIMDGDYLYRADSWNLVSGTFVGNLYTNIQIGDLKEPLKRRESEVLHFKWHNEQARQIVEGLYQDYAKLIAAAQKRYRRNSSRQMIVEIGTTYPKVDDAQTQLEDLFQNRFRKFFEAEGDAVLPLDVGLNHKELEATGGVARGSIEGRDIREFINDIFDYTAMAFQVPPQLLKGNVVDTRDAFQRFMTVCINPIAMTIETEITRKMYGKKYLQGSYVKMDTTNIQAVAIKDVANALDVLFRIGAYTIDDCLKYLGMEPVGGEIGQQRFVTKNYQPIEGVIDGGGGEQN